MNPSAPVDPRLRLVTETLRTQYWVWTYHTAETTPDSLLTALTTNLPHIDPTSWPERFDFGGVYVNGHAALTDQPLPCPCRIEYYQPKFDISAAASIFPAFEERFVVYSDDDILVAYKPPKLPSMPAKEQRHFSLKASIEKFCNRTIHMPSRLDVSAQGILIVSTSARAHAPLQQAFESRSVSKKYLFATTSPCTWNSKEISAPIVRDPSHPVLRTTHTENGKAARTIMTQLGRYTSGSSEVTALCAQPITGRTHQIRVHAASEGVAIFGDNFYGGESAPYLHLVSCILECLHPISKRPLRFVIPEPLRADWIRAALPGVQPQ
jgi:tRNA pseudouridine32 synthase/23S rRNA pseudouridine746 synthase